MADDWSAFPAAAAPKDEWAAFPAAAAPPAPQVSQGRAALEGALSGASANFRDEVYGASKASGLPDWLGGFRAPIGAARLAYEHFMGEQGDASKEYEIARDQIRAIQKRAKEEYPKTYMAGEVGGALALPGGALVQSATLPGRIARGAAVGAGYGAASGFGEGEGLADSATKAAIGLPIGAGVGAVAPPLVEGAIQGATALGRPLANAVRGAINPDSEAARKVVTAIDRDIRNDPTAASRLTPQEFASGVQQGDPHALIDLGGETTRALARSAANTSAEGRDLLSRSVNDRFESQSERVSNWLNSTFGASDTGATREALETAARQANRPAYRAAYRDGDQPLWTPELQRLVGSPDVVAAMKTAAEKGKSRAITEGFGGFNSSVQVSPSGVVTFAPGKNGQPTYPNLQFWDYTKRELDDAAKKAARTGADGEAGVLKQLAGALRGELDNLVPSYQNARGTAARFFGAENAIEAGEKFFKSNAPLNDVRREMTRMSAAERSLFQEGYLQSLTQKIEGSGDRRSILNAVMTSPREREKLEMAVGPQRSREFEAMMRVEGIMDMARRAIQGNSTTARQLAELGLAGSGAGMMGVGTYSMDPKEVGIGAVMAALAGGGRHIDQRVARRVAEMLTSDSPAVLRQGVGVLARSQNLMNSLRSVDGRIAIAGAGEGSGPIGGGVQGLLPSRAEDQKQ